MDNMEEEMITVPRKLLEDIYTDYIYYKYCFFTDKKEEAEKMSPDSYWNPTENMEVNKRYDDILNILKGK